MARTPALDRIARHVERTSDGCLEWSAATDNHGQPVIADDNGRVGYAHRVVYEAAHGPVGRRLIHRTCGNRASV